MIKKIIIFILAIFFNTHTFSQNWQWVKQGGSDLSDGVLPSFHDNNDNIYSLYFTDGYNLHLGADSITDANGIVIVKYDNSGNKIWDKSIRISSNKGGRMIYDSSADEIIVIGRFSGTLTCDTFTIQSILPEAGFVAKFDNGGNPIWVKRILESFKVLNIAGAVDDSSNIYLMTGTNTIYYIGTDTVFPGGNMIKLNSGGDLLWLKHKISFVNLSSGASIWTYAMKIYKKHIYISGETTNDSLSVDTITLINTNAFGVALACFNMNADVEWVKLIGTPQGQGGTGLDIDTMGNVYTVGHSYTVAHFDSDSLTSTSYPQGFIFKCDSMGNYIWAKNIPVSSGNTSAYSVSSSLSGETYVTGHFKGHALFGTDSLTSADSSMYIARYNANGTMLGVKTFGKAQGSGVITLSNGSPVVGGSFMNTVNIGSTTFNSYGNWDAFLARLDAFTGIENPERLANNRLIIYANPNLGKCTISVPDEFLNENNLVLYIYDSFGKLIQQKNLEMNAENIKLNLDSEAKGTYVANLSNGIKNFSGIIIFE